jgi:indole-3-glycerol phosphate synthase
MRRAGADGLLVGSAIMDGDVRANTERLSTPLDPDEAGGGSADTDTDADADGGT